MFVSTAKRLRIQSRSYSSSRVQGPTVTCSTVAQCACNAASALSFFSLATSSLSGGEITATRLPCDVTVTCFPCSTSRNSFENERFASEALTVSMSLIFTTVVNLVPDASARRASRHILLRGAPFEEPLADHCLSAAALPTRANGGATARQSEALGFFQPLNS